MLYIIIGIIVIFVVISILKFIGEFIDKILSVIGILGLYLLATWLVYHFTNFTFFQSAGIVIGCIVVLCLLYFIGVGLKKLFYYIRYKTFESKCLRYLNRKCKLCGYLTVKQWSDKLPDFAQKSQKFGKDFFSAIIEKFTKKCQKKYFSNEKWFYPFCEILDKQNGGTISDLLNKYHKKEIVCKELEYTHYDSDFKLLEKVLENNFSNRYLKQISTPENIYKTHNMKKRSFNMNENGELEEL